MFKNLTVAGNLRTSVVQQAYANDNIFVGKDGGGSLGWMFVHNSGQPSSAKSYVFMPPDPDFIGSRVILHACSAQDSSGTHIATHGMYVLGGRTFWQARLLRGERRYLLSEQGECRDGRHKERGAECADRRGLFFGQAGERERRRVLRAERAE